MSEFRSELENLFDVKELDFKLPPAFGRYRCFFPDEAVCHPAKFYVDVIEYIVKKYTKPGDLILDPMCGTGSGLVVAALHGRHGIGVDIEEKFVKWCLEAKRRIESHRTLTPKGKVTFICGDARELSKLLKDHVEEISSIITSPPYFDSGDSDSSYTKYNKGGKTRYLDIKLDGKAGLKSYGSIDVILTSPPYSESLSKKRKGYTILPQLEKTRNLGVDTRDDNIANLPHGNIDAIITSPPYSGTISRNAGGPVKVKTRVGESTLTARCYGESEKNIGNMEGETYIEAMLKVYSECFKVLRKGGKIIVIIKPFIRNKKVVDLPYHTYLMLRKVGFKIVEVWKYRLKRQSFWRILYYKKYTEVPRINHEYVIVGVKP